MKKSNSTKKAPSAFKKLGAVVLITATLAMFFTACNQTGGGGGGKPTPTPAKYTVTLNQTEHGTVTASPAIPQDGKVDENTEITFTAKANDGYRVKGWKLDGLSIAVLGTGADGSKTAKVKIIANTTVSVSFEAIPPTKYTVTLTQTEHGKVTASPEIPEDKQVLKDTVITFTAKADDGYKVGKWTVTPAEALQEGTGADGSETAKVKITADTTVSVSFEKIPTHKVTFSVEGGNGTLKAKSDGIPETETSPINVEHGKTVTFTAKASDGYRLKGWTLDGNAVNGTAETYTLTVTQPATISVSFEAIPTHNISFSVEGGNGTLKAKSDGIPETEASPINVEEGKTVTFTAKANDGYRVKGWTLDNSPITEAGTNTEYKLKVSKPATVSVSFEAIPPTKYTVTLNQAEGGTATALPEIPEDKQVLKDTEITFTATANAGYKIGKWTVTGSVLEAGTGADGSETAKVKITADTQVSVSFELIPKVILTLDPNKKDIEVKAKTADGSAIMVKGCTVAMLASGSKTRLTAKGTRVVLKGNITELDFSGTYINKQPLTAIDVSGLTSLQTLNCSCNQLTELNVQGLTALQALDCSNNKLTELNVQGLTALQALECNSNKLPELNVQGLTALQALECSNNKLPELNVQGLNALKKLECNSNKLPELNVQGLTSLQKLHCSSNQLTELNVQGLNALQWLQCSNNQLTALNVQGLTALRELNCGSNKLPELNVQGLNALKELNCHGNKLTALNVQGLTALETLSCYGNQIKAQAMTKLLNALPAREVGDNAEAVLYAEVTGFTEGNCKDFSQPAELKTAFDGAKKRNWKLQKMNASESLEDI